MTSRLHRYRNLFTLTALLGVAWLPSLQAADVAPQSELNPAPTFEPLKLPNPIDVPGKEYSTNVDKDANGNPDPGQVVHWLGNGETVANSFDYHADDYVGYGNNTLPFETDALANIRDKYFLDLDGTRKPVVCPEDNKEYRDTVSLLVSFQKRANYENNGYQNNVYASRSSFRGGGGELWADWHKNINKALTEADDLDGLEINGLDKTDDANMYSQKGDIDPDRNGRVSIFRFYPNQLNPDTETLGVSVPYLRTQTLLDAVIDENGAHPLQNSPKAAAFDLDGLMVWDVGEDANTSSTFGPGDQILFSIQPIEGLFDGGEIWLCKCDENGTVTTSFLTQGLDDVGNPVVWNTTNNVSQYFFGDDLHGENIDALEAVAPEPSTLILLCVPAGLLVWRRFRK